MNLEIVADIASHVSSCIVIGAYAVAARGFPRSTGDLDLMTTDRAALLDESWADLRAQGFEVSVRKGDFDDPLAGVVRFKGPQTSVDLVVCKYRWEQAVIDRAELIQISHIALRVPRIPDLILLKLSAGGELDLMDIRHLLDASGSRQQLVTEVTAALETLPKDMRTAWQRLLGESNGPRS